MRLPAVIFAAVPLLLGGCVSTVASVVTAPVRIASRAADMATTSQSEADENRGRELRRREERLGRLQREYEDKAEDCNVGSGDLAEAAAQLYACLHLAAASDCARIAVATVPNEGIGAAINDRLERAAA